MECTAIVLAGGESLRMGQEKGFIEFEGKRLIDRTVDVLRPIFKEIFIIAKKRELFSSFALPVYSDIFPNSGPMGGIYTGLLYSKGPVFAVACDMPYLNAQVILFLLEKIQNFDAAVFRSPDGLHPLHGVYSKSVFPMMEDILNHKRDLKMMKFLEKINTLEIDQAQVRHLDPKMRFLTNVNTPDELKRLLSF